MFDVYSQTQTAHGQLVDRAGDALIFSNKHVVCEENEQLIKIPEGQSYEIIVNDDEPLSLNFESSVGAGDGVTTELLLKVLLHREAVLLEKNHTEAGSLALRALQLAIDAFGKDDGS